MGLVGYQSSDDEDSTQLDRPAPSKPSAQGSVVRTVGNAPARAPDISIHSNGATVRPPQAGLDETSPSLPRRPAPGLAATPGGHEEIPAPEGFAQGPELGPALGPPRPPISLDPSQPFPTTLPLPIPQQEADPGDPPTSPYSATRALIRELALPGVSDTSIPPSPPGSPPPSLNAKVDQLLELKRTRGVHFNDRLADSAALRNPALMDKLLTYVELGIPNLAVVDSGDAPRPETGQYVTTLPRELGWDPDSLPSWAYKDSLGQAQERGHKERERRRGDPVEFVAAGDVGKTPSLVLASSVTGKRKMRLDE